jgi:hypothetical protein
MIHEFRSVPGIIREAGVLQGIDEFFVGLAARRVLLVCGIS